MSEPIDFNKRLKGRKIKRGEYKLKDEIDDITQASLEWMGTFLGKDGFYRSGETNRKKNQSKEKRYNSKMDMKYYKKVDTELDSLTLKNVKKKANAFVDLYIGDKEDFEQKYQKAFNRILAEQTSDMISKHLKPSTVTGYTLDVKTGRESIDTDKVKIYMKDGIITKTLKH